jgi:hypothetical protein
MLQQSDEFSEHKIVENLQSGETIVKCDINNINRYAKNAIRENNVHMASLKEVLKGQITELDGSKSEQ